MNVLPFAELPLDESYAYLDMPVRRNLGAVVTKYRVEVDGCAVTVGYTKPMMYIAREIAGNACLREHILAHEAIHVQIYRDALATLASRIEARAGELDLASVALAELQAVKPKHAELDSPEEYKENFRVCRRQAARLVTILAN